MLVAIGIFSFGTAQAVIQIDGLMTNAATVDAGNALAPNTVLPTGLNIYVNPGGTGDALIYGYYNARGSWDFIRVVNTSTNTGIGAKVRFREGRNSNEVLDFFICLSAGDQWSAWLIDDGNVAHPATLVWADSDTPSFPDPQGDDLATNNYGASVSLKYSATGAPSSVTADDTKEGYFEIIGNVAWADVPGPTTRVIKTPNKCGKTVLTYGPASTTGTFLSVFGGTDPITSTTVPTLYDVPNVLIGDTFIFNIAAAQGTYAYNATALANFRNAPIAGSLGVDSVPTLSDATDTLVGVSYVLTKATEYALYDFEISGQTTIINTFPTKRLSMSFAWGMVNTAKGPFNNSAYLGSDGRILSSTDRCETIGVTIWDDKENTPSITGCTFSPCSVTPTTYQKCDEVSLLVVGKTASALLNSALVQTPQIDQTTFTLGWISEDFTTVVGRWTNFGGTTSPAGAYTYGLPVISYELQGFVRGYFTHMLPLQYTVQTSPGDSFISGR